MLERLKEQHAEQTEDDGQAAEETPTEETTPELSTDTGTCVHTGILSKKPASGITETGKSQKLRHNLLDYYHHYYIMESTGKPDKYIR